MSSIYRISESPARSSWAAGRYKNGFITQYCPAGLLTGYNNQIVKTTDTVPLAADRSDTLILSFAVMLF